MTDPQLGRVINERFKITSRVGEGGMGIVYLADDLAAGGQAAVKFLHPQFLQNEDFVARFRQEARSASRFRHENAVRILDAGDTEDGAPFLVMEYCPGPSLKAVLRDDGPLQVSRSCRIAEQLLRALGAAHKSGIIHRDLKPENIKVETDVDGTETVKVLDFGVAKFIGTEDVQEMTGAVKTRTGVVFGTPKYMAPEQILGEPVDGRSDIYSVGAILYEMLTGGPPFQSDDIMGFVTKHLKEPVEPPSSRVPDRAIPAGLEKIVLEMLEKNRVARPARAGEVAEALDPFTRQTRVEESDAAKGGFSIRALVYLLAAVAGAVLVAIVAPAHRFAGIAVAMGLGAGATLAFIVFPRVGDAVFWIRVAIVAGLVSVGAAVAVFVGGGDVPVTIALAVGALLTFALYSAGWGRRSRGAGLVLGGILAPLLAIPLLPFPKSDGHVWIGEAIGDFSLMQPALAMVCIALTFGLLSLPAPYARVGGK